MRVRVLGCHGGETPRHRTTCLLIDERITIDAGAVCRSLALDEQVKLDHMLISHSHMDHVKDLALLADQVIGRRGHPVVLHCGPETAETLSSSYFNNYLWPDFTKIPTPQSPVMLIDVHEPEVSFRIPPSGVTALAAPAAKGKRATRGSAAATKKATAGKRGTSSKKGSSKAGAATASAPMAHGPLAEGEYQVQFIPVTHPVESMAMIIRGTTGSILYSSDTGPTTRLWQLANKVTDLRGMFVELSFPNHMQALADVAGHYTPQTLEAELKKVRDRDDIPLFIYHLKPTFYEVTKNELAALRLKNMHLVELTDEFAF
ncbi:MAG: 3',5'-cyclic-nucleotide phosphodiesterase [Deltaproteobacteria bacterium]|nr:3',5'-cyclic-nucleotide phosphodiesterase [Deltaproteobacteria bacterium]